jgi:5-methylcytosine-specific restriction protein A
MSGRFYSTQNWTKISKAQLARQPICEGCEVAPATLVDHVIEITKGGAKRDRRNLRSLCAACHNQRHGAERAGKQWVMPKHKGCDEHGVPRDPAHTWNKAEP